MKSIFEGLSQITALLGTPVSAETLAAGTVRTDVSGIDFRSVGEFLRSEDLIIIFPGDLRKISRHLRFRRFFY